MQLSSRPESRSKTPNRRSRRSLRDNQRPATANRQRTRTHSRLIGEKPSELPPLIPDPLPKEPVSEVVPKPIADPVPVTEPLLGEGKEGEAQETEAAKGEDVAEETPFEEVQLPVERPATATTWKTTSSQRRYIDELERLLKEERKVNTMQRRILAEAKLS